MTRTKIKISWTSSASLPGIERPTLRRAITAFLAELGFRGVTLHLLLADDAELRALNARFRNLDRPTDILSWRYDVPDQGAAEEGLPFGELAVSMERVAAQATENGWAAQTELLRLLAHGCVHLAGYDHETPETDQEMRKIEEGLLAKIGLTDLYSDRSDF